MGGPTLPIEPAPLIAAPVGPPLGDDDDQAQQSYETGHRGDFQPVAQAGKPGHMEMVIITNKLAEGRPS
ncbi:hypothetical protein ATO49_25245 [Mycolicibacterium fortuitum subsp. fortuitum DSM 46621 = ATCC 6841 = JCM 6387]|nr:hypothetical protein ATO49_25245 [Mycolicibacterium fortuitum subsp. fortuitum DSM 46621 = ATCC 6841 = JCM 6387]